MRVQITPRFARGLSTARHRNGLEGGKPLVAVIVGQQEFAAPERAVVAETKPVERNAEDSRCAEWVLVLG
jgi:hypothetical protein